MSKAGEGAGIAAFRLKVSKYLTAVIAKVDSLQKYRKTHRLSLGVT
jgi:hypothetical protein